MAQNAQSPDDEEARKELLATIAASRDLGPEMDQTLADRYIEQQQKAKAKAQSRALAQPPQYAPVGRAGQSPQVGPFRGGPIFLAPLAGIIIVAAIVATAFGHPEALGLLWLAFFLFGGAFWRRRGMYGGRGRYYRRYGMYEDGYGMGAPMQPPMMGGPQQPPQQYDLPPSYSSQPQAPYSPAPQPTPAPPAQSAPAPSAPPTNPAG